MDPITDTHKMMSEHFNFERFPQLKTERLILREIVAADAEAVFQFRSDPEEQKHEEQGLVLTRKMMLVQ